jgi:GNAT superfamily N-acetyltransferase
MVPVKHSKVQYRIASARPHDVGRVPLIELAAAALLRGHAPDSVLAETTSEEELLRASRQGLLWVALADDVAVGFALVRIIDGRTAHLEEVDVLPEHGRRGLGTRLVAHACRWAETNGFECVTLTTFRDVPWNRPFYERLGFRVMCTTELSPKLHAIVDGETRRGLDPARRVVMRRWTLHRAEPTPGDVQYLEDRIYEYNSRVTGIADGALLGFFVRGDDRIVAGIYGNTWGGTCEVRLFWVEESLRGQGLGTSLLAAAEREAVRRGCTQMTLMTFSFQAPRFYGKHGFEIVATLENHPDGHQNLLLRKTLQTRT